MGASIQLRGWGWRYAGRKAWACRGVDLDIAAGERVLLVGPSGAGKSTLLRAVAGLLEEDVAAEYEGTVLVDGLPARATRDRIGLLMQDPEASLVMSRSGDDVAFGLENAGVPADEIWPRVDAAMAQVGFSYGRDRSTAALSGGEQQRLALAGALVRRPGVLVLDEPTANLDPPGGAEVLAAVVVLAPGGGVVEDGAPDDVFSRRGPALAAAGVWVPPRWGPPPHPHVAGPGGSDLLVAEHLGLTYPGADRPALADAGLRIRRGEATAITGPNGSGKSTLAMLLAGLMRPGTGTVRLTDAPQVGLHRWSPRDLCRRIGTVFQNPEHQFLARTVRDELLVGPRQVGIQLGTARERCDELLGRLRLDRLAGANPFTLSGGEKRRLSVAAVLATAPDLLILDEPTFGQDAQTWTELVDLCIQLRAEGTAVVTVTHDLAFADALADHRIEVRAGRITSAADRALESSL